MGLGSLPAVTSKTLVVGNLPVHYVEAGEGQPIVLLHGWGGQVASFGRIPTILAERCRVVAVDLPGFGQTPLAERPWGTADYAECIAALVDRLRLAPCTLLGHSFGGQIAIALAATYPELVGKLILVDSAGIRSRRGPV